MVTPELFDDMEQTWAPPTDPVFKLVPDTFQKQISAIYTALDSSQVTLINFWIIYTALLDGFTPDVQNSLAEELLGIEDHFEFKETLIPNQRDLRAGDAYGNYKYLGGLANPPPESDEEEEQDADPREYADFTDDEAEFD